MQERKLLHLKAQRYRDLLLTEGWEQLAAEIEAEALIAANTLIGERLIAGESAEAYALRQVQHQAFITACRIIYGIPATVIAEDDEALATEEIEVKERSHAT